MTALASASVRNRDVAWNERCDELVERERAKFFEAEPKLYSS